MTSGVLAKPVSKRSPFDLGQIFQQFITSITNFVNPGPSRQDYTFRPENEGPTDEQIYNGLLAFKKLQSEARPQYWNFTM